ncbi:MAG TPA: malic enzyme-like NAD(P)-binding protein [Sedimentibacter sp.]|nr:malic enzyme-like NAD(P)-binding protein [Sedimentibacter sp.]HQK52896.1 malic enzyme-like NAD(P)-binding protein [Sedimentibacter sp.]HQO71631.1 malic enzyme-like NAD(P)-binding protein [Sedimentibacter sp.]HQO94945.1 malic enzyme-like NAD(P)-binding protein [Sedimentibacter sp.]
MGLREEALKLHKDNKGKIEVISKVRVENAKDLSLAYTPGVAEPCKEIHANPELIYDYTNKGNMVAVVTDGSAVLGLGNIGSRAGMPVMEGKAVLFKSFANVDAFPICIESQDVDIVVQTVKQIAPSFGGINLEDIAAPRCFEIEERLKKELDIPVFHDDQHGTAVVVLAGIINALKAVGKKIENVTAVVSGAGAAGIAISKLLLSSGINDVIICNSRGILDKEDERLDPIRKEMALKTNKANKKGALSDALKGADIFIGVSAPNIVTKKMIESMNENSIAFAMANPIPEILPEVALAGKVKVMGTGRSDFPNQINNVLAFPGIFRGALDVRAKEINEEMKIAAAHAIAELVTEEELNEEYIIPKAFDKRVAKAVARAVSEAAIKTGVNRI